MDPRMQYARAVRDARLAAGPSDTEYLINYRNKGVHGALARIITEKGVTMEALASETDIPVSRFRRHFREGKITLRELTAIASVVPFDWNELRTRATEDVGGIERVKEAEKTATENLGDVADLARDLGVEL